MEARCAKKSPKRRPRGLQERKNAKNEPKTPPKGAHPKVRRRRVPSSRRASPLQQENYGGLCDRRFNTRVGLGTPAYCDASRTSAGVLIENPSQQGQMIQSISKICAFFPEKAQNLRKSSQNPPKSLPKSIQNRSRRPLGAHLGPMLEKSSILNAPQTAKRRPRAPKRRPKPSQMPPK